MKVCRRFSMLSWIVFWIGVSAAHGQGGPYDAQVAAQLERLQSAQSLVQAGAAEALAYLRAYGATSQLVRALRDSSPLVRREAAVALGWCGDRTAVQPLLDALDDSDWVTRQAAHVALTNLTGMELPFDSLAAPQKRTAQANVWRQWWHAVPEGHLPEDTLKLLDGVAAWTSRWSVTASTTYKGPPDVLVDGQLGPAYWQTKNVSFPQWCTVDLREPQEISKVTVYQYGPDFVMTDCALSTSLDGQHFEEVVRRRETTPVELTFKFKARKARFVRITSYGTNRKTYPTTFYEIEINDQRGTATEERQDMMWRVERGLRSAGALGGPEAAPAILAILSPDPPTAAQWRAVVRAAIRALGRQRDEAGFQRLLSLLDEPMWARYAADALGDRGDERAVLPLMKAYDRYAKGLDGRDPPDVPRDDKMGFPSEDRMLETPHAIILALSRLPIETPEARDKLRSLAGRLVANLPGDHDTFMLYEPEGGHLLTRYLLNKAGLRQAACEHVFASLGQPRRTPVAGDEPEWPRFAPYRMAGFLPTICTDPQDVDRCVALLDHPDGWVRINAAKTLAFIGDRRAIEPIADRLSRALPEAAYGYSGTFKDEEYRDPAPRWREALVRALGLLGAHDDTTMLIEILNDPASVLGVRHAACRALADLGNEQALAALERAAIGHSFYSVRHVARDALHMAGRSWAPAIRPQPADPVHDAFGQPVDRQCRAIIFIKGSNSIPNTLGTVEQADRWRQTYVVTDSGPVYRPGRNLYRLEPLAPDGRVEPVTSFDSGYVGDPEVSWDGRQVVFTYRGETDPWWHLFVINADGTQLRQLTHGPYHDVGPTFLPDGRIVFSTSRAGIRDEYHGYPCTALWVLDPQSGFMEPLATNIGRDNEPSILPDGRIVFSRLEVFYSRNKTELTLHAAHPDGTFDSVLYGPERRVFWRQLNHGPRTPADGQEAPLTHRVLRMTQPQPLADARQIVVVTQGGLVAVRGLRDRETFISPDNQQRSYTTPFPLPDGRILCASTMKVAERDRVDLGIYSLDPQTGKLELVYNDPETADFEPRPLMARPRPPQLPRHEQPDGYAGRFVCASVFQTQEAEVRRRGRLVRLIEGVPVVTRHSTQTNPWPVWKNHGGTHARVLGTAPLAADGSFYVEAPADRLLHFQVLDSDGFVVGNQLTWIYPRPGETRSCVGCHENPHSASAVFRPKAQTQQALSFLPHGDEFSYRAKAWFKGHLPDEIEMRTRTVRAVNLIAR